MDISQSVWNETDSSNNTAAPDGAPEGMQASGVNDVIRADRGAIKRWYNWTKPLTTTSSGTPTAYVLTYGVAPTALADDMIHNVRFDAVNAGATATLNVNGLGAKPIYSYQAGAWAQVTAGTITPDTISRVSYNTIAGAYFLLDVSEASPFVITKTVTAGAALDFGNGIPAGMNHVEIHFNLLPATNAVDLGLQFYGSGGVLDTGNNYSYAENVTTQAGTNAPAGTGSVGAITLNRAGNPVSNSTSASGRIDIQGIQAASATKCQFHTTYLDSGSSLLFSNVGGGQHTTAARITGAYIAFSSGNATGTGTLTARR